MKTINKALLIGATALTLTATAASAAVVCNDEGDCWRVRGSGATRALALSFASRTNAPERASRGIATGPAGPRDDNTGPAAGLISLPMYLGPDAALPLASAAAAVVGLAVMFWHRTVAAAKGILALEGDVDKEHPAVGKPVISVNLIQAGIVSNIVYIRWLEDLNLAWGVGPPIVDRAVMVRQVRHNAPRFVKSYNPDTAGRRKSAGRHVR